VNKFLDAPIELAKFKPKEISIPAPKAVTGYKPETPKKEPAAINSAPLRAGAMKMLKVAAMFHPRSVSKQQIATMVGYSMKGGTFGTYLSELKRNGWIEGDRNRLRATDGGLEAAGDIDDLPSDPQSIIDMWSSKFRAGAAKMLRVIAEKYPEPISKEDLGDMTDFTVTGGTFNTYLSELRRNGLIIVNRDEIRATPELFLEDT